MIYNKAEVVINNEEKFEKLFWKVFHNMVIRDHIINLIRLEEYVDYRNYSVNNRKKLKEIKDLEWMLEKKLYQLIHYKLNHADQTDRINVTDGTMKILFSLLSNYYKNINRFSYKNNINNHKRQLEHQEIDDDQQQQQHKKIKQTEDSASPSTSLSISLQQPQQHQTPEQMQTNDSIDGNDNNDQVANDPLTLHCTIDINDTGDPIIVNIVECIINSSRDASKYLELSINYGLFQIAEFIIKKINQQKQQQQQAVTNIGDQICHFTEEFVAIYPNHLQVGPNENTVDLLWFLNIKSTECQLLLLDGFTFEGIESPTFKKRIMNILSNGSESGTTKLKGIYRISFISKVGYIKGLNKSEIYRIYLDKFDEAVTHFGINPGELLVKHIYRTIVSYCLTRQSLKFIQYISKYLMGPPQAPPDSLAIANSGNTKFIYTEILKSFSPLPEDTVTFENQIISNPLNFIGFIKIYLSMKIEIKWIEERLVNYMVNNIDGSESYKKIFNKLELNKSKVYPPEFDKVLISLLKYYQHRIINQGSEYTININNSNSIKWLFKYSDERYKLLLVNYLNRHKKKQPVDTGIYFTFESIQLLNEFNQLYSDEKRKSNGSELLVITKSFQPDMEKIDYLFDIFNGSSKSNMVSCNSDQLNLIFQHLIYLKSSNGDTNNDNNSNGYYNNISNQSNESLLQITNYLNYYDLFGFWNNELYNQYFINQKCFNQFIKEIINNQNVNSDELVNTFSRPIEFYNSLLDLLLESILGDVKLDTTTLSIILNKYDPIKHYPILFIEKYNEFLKLNGAPFQIFKINVPVDYLSPPAIIINQEITKLSKEQLVDCIELLIRYLSESGCIIESKEHKQFTENRFTLNKEDHISLVNKYCSIIEEIINYLFKKLISIKFISSDMVVKVYRSIESVGIKINHSFYHSIHYFAIRSSKFQKLIQSHPFGISVLYQITEEQFGDGEYILNTEYRGYEIRNIVIPEKYTFNYIFNEYDIPFSDMLYSLLLSLLALDRISMIEYHDLLLSQRLHFRPIVDVIAKSYHYKSFNSMLEFALDIGDELLFSRVLDLIENQFFSESKTSNYTFTHPNSNPIKNHFIFTNSIYKKINSKNHCIESLNFLFNTFYAKQISLNYTCIIMDG